MTDSNASRIACLGAALLLVAASVAAAPTGGLTNPFTPFTDLDGDGLSDVVLGGLPTTPGAGREDGARLVRLP